MKKRLLFYCIVLGLALSVPLAAESRLVDNAGLLNGVETKMIEAELNAVSENYRFDLVIVTEHDIGGASPMNYADDFFDYNNYGSGENRDGCLFLIVTGSRDYWFSTSGRGNAILNDAAENKLEAGALGFLQKDDYSGAFRSFTRDWEQFLALDAKGGHYNFFHEWNIVLVIAAWILSFIIGCVVVQTWASRMNTVSPATQAAAYMVPGSLNFSDKRDRFLYSTVTRTRRQTQSSSSGGGIHRGSSGSFHGGRGGKY